MTAIKPVILPPDQKNNLSNFFRWTSECLEGPADPIKSREKSSKKTRFPITRTSKFSAARKVVGETGKEVTLQRTLAFGSQYGIGVFCPTEAGEQQIGWVSEKDPCNFGCCWKGLRLAKLSCQNWQCKCQKYGRQVYQDNNFYNLWSFVK